MLEPCSAVQACRVYVPPAPFVVAASVLGHVMPSVVGLGDMGLQADNLGTNPGALIC